MADLNITGRKGATATISGLLTGLVALKITPWIVSTTGVTGADEYITVALTGALFGMITSIINFWKHWVIPLLKTEFTKRINRK